MEMLEATAFAVAAIVACVGWGRSVEALIGGWGGAPPLPRLSTGTAGCIGMAVSLCGAGLFVAIDQYRPWIG